MSFVKNVVDVRGWVTVDSGRGGGLPVAALLRSNTLNDCNVQYRRDQYHFDGISKYVWARVTHINSSSSGLSGSR